MPTTHTSCIIHTVYPHKAPLKRLGKFAFGTFLTSFGALNGIRSNCRPLHGLATLDGAEKHHDIQPLRAEQLVQIDLLQDSFDVVRKSVTASVARTGMCQTHAQNKRINILQLDLSVGDYALVRRLQTLGHKLRFL